MTLRRFFNSAFLLLALSLLPISAAAQWTAPNPVVDFQKQPDGVLIHQKTGTLRLQVCSPAIIHLTYSPTADFPATPNPVIIKTNLAGDGVETRRRRGSNRAHDVRNEGSG